MSMRLIGNVLLWCGVVVGVISGVWLWFGPSAGGLPWFVGVGLIKLTFAAGLALIATGAVALRMDNRARLRQQLDGADPEVVVTADRKATRTDARLRR
jgi:HAMP domain-containing protein